MDQLLSDYEKNAYRYRNSTQEFFIKIARKIFKNDIRRLEKVVDTSINFVKSEATNIKFLS